MLMVLRLTTSKNIDMKPDLNRLYWIVWNLEPTLHLPAVAQTEF